MATEGERARHKARYEKLKANPALLEEKKLLHRRNWLQSHFNISMEQYDELLHSQNGVCAICLEADQVPGRRLAVDHDRSCCPGSKSCGQCIRGLLCGRCNGRLLPTARDNPEILDRAAAYLRNFPLLYNAVREVVT